MTPEVISIICLSVAVVVLGVYAEMQRRKTKSLEEVDEDALHGGNDWIDQLQRPEGDEEFKARQKHLESLYEKEHGKEKR